MRNKKVIKFSVILFFAMSILAFGYSLGFFTDFLPIRGSYRELYDSYQLFNRELFKYTGIAIAPMLLLFVFDNHSTNQYGIINKVLALVTGGFALFQSYFVLTQIEFLRSGYQLIDVEEVRIYYPKYELSEVAFDAAYIIFIGLAIAAVLLIAISVVNKKDKEVK